MGSMFSRLHKKIFNVARNPVGRYIVWLSLA